MGAGSSKRVTGRGGGTESGGAEGAQGGGCENGDESGGGGMQSPGICDGRRRSRSAAALSMSTLERESRRVKRSVRPPTPGSALGLYPTTRPSPRTSTCPEERTSSNRSTTP